MVTLARRLTAGTVAAALTIAGASLLAAPPASAAPLQTGLFGSADPTYDGVFRQSLSLLAYVAADQDPPAEAVDWLLGQQCADGGFEAFRADPTTACATSNPDTYSGEDTNSTGLAAAALHALGADDAADDALAWLDDAQNADGGFPYFVGGQSDSNSTSVVLMATNTAGLDPTEVAVGKASAADYLASVQVGCSGAATDEDGGFAFQDYGTGLVANDASSAQATLAVTGTPLPFVADAASSDIPRADCAAPAAVEKAPASPTPSEPTPDASTGATPTASPSSSPSSSSASRKAAAVTAPGVAELGAGYLARLLDAYDGAVPLFDYDSGTRTPGTVSAGDTAWAVLSLAAVGVGSEQIDAALDVLAVQTTPAKAASAKGTASAAATDQPGLLALRALAVTATGGSADTVDGLVDRIGATMRTGPATATPTPTASPSDPEGNGGTLPDTGATRLTAIAGAGGLLLVLVGAVLVAVTRRRSELT